MLFTYRCQKLLQSGEGEIYLHALGAAIPRALNLALKIQKFFGNRVTLDTTTSTVELTDDFEPRTDNGGEGGSRTRHNSGVYIKITHKTPSSDQQQQPGATDGEEVPAAAAAVAEQ